MSKYTTELRYICETYARLTESEDYRSIDSIIEEARHKIFDFDYPIFDEDYREVLETKIIKHYYLREIGAETVGLWKFFLSRRMNEIMPYYNQRYESTLIEFNPLHDTDLTTDHNIDLGNVKNEIGENIGKTNNVTSFDGKVITDGNKTNTGGSTTDTTHDSDSHTHTSSRDNNDSWNYYSDTPQGGVEGLANMTYLTNASHDAITNNGNTDTDLTGGYTDKVKVDRNEIEKTDDVQTTDNTTTYNEDSNYTNKVDSKFNSSEKYLEHIVGKRNGASFSQMLQEFRDTFINVDMEIIENLNDLFMGLW